MNILKWLPVILKAMSTVQKIKSASGPDKLQAVLDDLEENIELLEGAVGKDILKQEKVAIAVTNAVNAVKALERAIKSAKEVIAKTDNE